MISPNALETLTVRLDSEEQTHEYGLGDPYRIVPGVTLIPATDGRVRLSISGTRWQVASVCPEDSLVISNDHGIIRTDLPSGVAISIRFERKQYRGVIYDPETITGITIRRTG